MPDGRACRFRVQPLLKKYSVFPKTQITLYPPPSRPDQRGVGHRRERWGGLRWTRQRRVCKGSQGGFPVSDDRHADERCCSRTAKTCGPDASTPASSLRKASRPDRARMNQVSADDGDKKADHRGERGISRKPLRPGMPGDFRWLAVNTRVHTCYQ